MGSREPLKGGTGEAVRTLEARKFVGSLARPYRFFLVEPEQLTCADFSSPQTR
jgi:hypothetical protein